uniref:Mg2+ and Co2+ transporter CorB, contains DUF21, CBS pair, and CorC-HlyC domains n=1 Tax=Candidatus Kentrum sp. FM TaxID=2126340 RepID=A0A450W666_9GAMM|nr:MAG: Mg2+ and Co2+ transporter CorB, contains DUF21, CBS pair, and CorC-HlyC domains [Candidatus Kentron sp. FM]VFJ71070.1 MAG: Mg2+ and Co2+ transporter CorB, contains DUF21, CBS pair, and CorC-HlyC domains [Candidatus Kentron sp. FM]VFK12499.1 MAG: Mg2+ and Co2+ transporter CorB, contains DUF21, CBS pair, and CorC-HlyC domains [Candidatus Kentron sp. FM]
MSELPLGVLLGTLLLLIISSAFFSGSETGMMALNRYRLRHLVKHKHRAAIRTTELLERPDRLIGLILLGNNFVNLLASALATVLAIRIWGEAGILIATLSLTAVILIFAEVTPKTLAVLHPERIAFPASVLLKPLLTVFYPGVWVINWLSNGLLRLVGIRPQKTATDKLTGDELRTVVNEAGALISKRHKQMLVSILDLDTVTVDDIMIPRNEVSGIDLEDTVQDIREYLINNRYSRVPIYRGDITNVLGVVRTRELLTTARHNRFDGEHLIPYAREPFFVPAGTPLHTQLVNFQRHRERMGLVVDEYGDIQGLVTLEDILEEIVGEFTTDPASSIPDVHPQADGSYLVDGSASIRALNRTMRWELPVDGPKTLNGLILEHLETIPEAGTSMLLAGYPINIIQTRGHVVKTVRLHPAERRSVSGEESPE